MTVFLVTLAVILPETLSAALFSLPPLLAAVAFLHLATPEADSQRRRFRASAASP